jgi:hypothetical protein
MHFNPSERFSSLINNYDFPVANARVMNGRFYIKKGNDRFLF